LYLAHDAGVDKTRHDSSGRIRQGPAPANLPVPPYQFVSDTKIQIG